MKYKIRLFQDETYEVIDVATNKSMFQGSLSDCAAWISLAEKGYIN